MGSPGGSDSLLIYGAEDDSSWYVSVGIGATGERAGCGVLNTTSAWDAGDSVLFAFTGYGYDVVDVGVLLKKADAWNESAYTLEPGGRYPFALQWWCIDADGRVVSVSQAVTG